MGPVCRVSSRFDVKSRVIARTFPRTAFSLEAASNLPGYSDADSSKFSIKLGFA